ncbi:MAG TPA: prepilin-type N-terminal cleavage/methylation domain-containing protein [Candidatus Moranbacteria bacterium]|nr:prepilin-type N-terminal cleavage/methylation domain-containing protein [Candidatus Moranbacteria bacterium]
MKKKLEKKIKGLTLIEMMMAIAIFTIGIAGFTLLFSRTWKSNSYVLEMGQSSMAASQGVNKIVNYIRKTKQADDGAYPIKSASSNDLVIYSDYDKDGIAERLHFYKSGQNILMGATNPTTTLPKSYPSGDQETITLVSSVTNASDEPIFYYYNKDYPGDSTNNPLSSPVTSHLAEIRLVKIYVEINTNPNRGPENIKIQSFVEMRNLSDYDRVQ